MFINFWYAAELSEKLGDTPLRVRILSHDLVLFRDTAGKAHCLSDTCIHRGASLSGGKVRGDCLQCPYHGWEFGGDGKCQKIPSLGPEARTKVPSRGRVDSYPTEERYGLVFVFLGDLPESERPPIMPIPEWGQEGWRGGPVDYYWNANYERAIENGLDPAHNEFVHPTHGFSGERDDYKVGDLRTEESDWGFGFMHTFQSPPLKNPIMRMMRNYEGDLEAGSGHHGANGMWTFIHLTPTTWFHQYVYETPVDENTLHTFLVSMRNKMLPKWIDKTVNKRNFAIAEQDRVVIERLQPTCTPPTRTKELMTPSDKVIGMYRDGLNEYEKLGWRIDTHRLNQERAKGNVVFAIPSPGRRESKAWVLDPTPLVPPQEAESPPIRAVSS
jgi:phenylpropionate dioxygenase-like ring-hydroxylating dioxygenase large terminal subunit